MKNLFLLFVFLPLFTFAQGYGIITLIKGPVQAKSADGKLRELKKGDKVFESETVITTDKSIARIVMMDTNIIDVYRSSKLLIKEYIYNPKEDNKNVKLEVTEGRIKSTVKQKYDNDKNKYNVKTPVIVAGVRGTIFTTEHESKTGESRVITHEGNVMVGKLDANDHVKEFFSVKANQTIQLDKQTAKPEVKDILKPEVDRQRDSDKKDGFTSIEKELDKNKKDDTKNRIEEDKNKSDGTVKNNDSRGEERKDNDKKSDDSKKEDKAPSLEEKRGSKENRSNDSQIEEAHKQIEEELKKKRKDHHHEQHEIDTNKKKSPTTETPALPAVTIPNND